MRIDAILITHQLEEAISVGDRIVVLGKSATLLADIHAQWPEGDRRRGCPGDPSACQRNRRCNWILPLSISAAIALPT